MGAAVPIVGGIFKAGAELSEAQDKKWQLEDEARAATNSAITARQAGKYNAQRQERMAGKVIGSIHADYAASGISSDSVSALDVLRESHINAELDRQNILFGADTKARNFQERAAAAKEGAKSAEKAGQFGAFSALFGGAALAGAYGD